MARALAPTSHTPADEMRDLLDSAERRLTNLRGTGKDVVQLLDWLDRIAVLAAQAEIDGADLRPELGRLQTIEARLRERAALIVREAGAELHRARLEAEATPDRWWWYVDEIAAAAWRRQLRRLGLVALGIAGVVFVIWFVFYVLYPEDPKVAAVQRLQGVAERSLNKGDLPGALAAYEEAVQTDPEDPSLVIWIGVLQEQLGQKEISVQKFNEAETMFGDHLRFLLERGRAYAILGLNDAALADFDAAVALNPESAEGQLLRGGILEAQGKVDEALAAYELASSAAQENQPELAAVARMRLGTLLQRGAALPATTPTPTATP